MRSSLVCVGIAIAMFATACDKKEKVAAPQLPVPECKTEQAYDAEAFEQIVRAMDRSGDLAQVSRHVAEQRKPLERALAARDPRLVARLKPTLDAQFSEASLRARVACMFVPIANDRAGVKSLQAWSRSPEMQAINTAIWSRTAAPSEAQTIKMTPARMRMLREIAVGMALQQIEVNIQKTDLEAVPSLVAIFGPAPEPPQPVAPVPSPAQAAGTSPATPTVAETAPPLAPAVGAAPAPTTAPAPTAAPASAAAAGSKATSPPAAVPAPIVAATPVQAPAPAVAVAPPGPPAPGNQTEAMVMAELNLQTGPPPMPSVDETVQRWLLPTLSKVPDEDLAQFVTFVGGRFGGDYYVSLSRTYDLKAGEWYAQMVKSFTDNIPPAELLPGAPDRNALVTDARRALRDVATPAAAADAMAKLQQADRLDPRDAEIQMLLGEAAMKTAPPMPLTPGVLRVVIATPNYDIADRYLATALQLQPGLADAYMLQGRLRFLQGKDDDALALYARAQKLEPDHPSLDLYRGDVAYAQNQLMQAINFYKASIAQPERLAFTHVSALRNLLMALQKSTQLPQYQRIADAYLVKNPEAWNFRLDYADYLLSIDTPADKTLGVIEPVPDSWFPARKTPALSAALVRKAVERVDKRTSEPTDESMRLMRRARSLNPEVGPMAEAMCRGDITTRLVRRTLETTPNSKSLATALVLCGLRWRRDDIVRAMATRADIARLSVPQADLGGDTPLCYSVLTKNLVGFIQLAEARVSPARKCNDGNTVAERLLQMSYGRDPNIVQMQILMKRFYKKE